MKRIRVLVQGAEMEFDAVTLFDRRMPGREARSMTIGAEGLEVVWLVDVAETGFAATGVSAEEDAAGPSAVDPPVERLEEKEVGDGGS